MVSCNIPQTFCWSIRRSLGHFILIFFFIYLHKIFLIKYALRIEYSLKAASFHTGEGNANPNWTTFAHDIDSKFQAIQDKKLNEAKQYILSNPPKKQVIEQGNIAWSDAAPTPENGTDLLLLYVRRVRNNLFHGGKFNGNWFAPERSEELLNSSIIVLGYALASNDKVKEAFEN